jgi:DNA polymerase
MTKQAALKEIQDKWLKDCTCELRETATQGVPGDGNAESPLVFIGEAPGKDEDIQGRPFVGRSGQFLAEMLESIGMKREDIYITNIVKYRPPNNRDPLPEEKDACRPWLIEELNLIKPKLIVFLGRHSMNDYFPTEKISQVHGKILIKKIPELGRQHFLALYHPAAALYNGDMRETLIEDFKKIPRILKKIEKED